MFITNYFRFKDFVPEMLRSSFIYKFSCGSWTASYIGNTYSHYKVRIWEHQGVFPRTCKPVKGTKSTLLGISFLTSETKRWNLEITLHPHSSNKIMNTIDLIQPALNKTFCSTQLQPTHQQLTTPDYKNNKIRPSMSPHVVF